MLGHVHDGIHGNLWIGLDEAGNEVGRKKKKRERREPDFSLMFVVVGNDG